MSDWIMYNLKIVDYFSYKEFISIIELNKINISKNSLYDRCSLMRVFNEAYETYLDTKLRFSSTWKFLSFHHFTNRLAEKNDAFHTHTRKYTQSREGVGRPVNWFNQSEHSVYIKDVSPLVVPIPFFKFSINNCFEISVFLFLINFIIYNTLRNK